MAIVSTAGQVDEVPIVGRRGTFTVKVRSLRHRELARASLVFSRVQRGQSRIAKLIPAAAAPAEGEGIKLYFNTLSPEVQDAVLEASADMMDDLIKAGAYGLVSVDGLHDGDGRNLQVPDTLAGREEFIDAHFEFVEMHQLARAVVERSTVTEADSGNSP